MAYFVLRRTFSDHFLDESDKSHNAPVPYHIMHHSERKCAYFLPELYTVGYMAGVVWPVWEHFLSDLLWRMRQVHCGVCVTGQYHGRDCMYTICTGWFPCGTEKDWLWRDVIKQGYMKFTFQGPILLAWDNLTPNINN